MKNITVIYDNESIPWVDFDTLFEVLPENESNTSATWTSALVIDRNGAEVLYCFIRIPHYSQHSITIQSTGSLVIQGIGGVLAIVVFIAVVCLLGVVYFIPYFLVRKSK